MKKNVLLLSLIFSFLFISCSSDDDSGDDKETGTESILGVWQLESEFGAEASELDDCDKTSTIEFEVNNDLTYREGYMLDDVCTFGEATGTWENIDNDTYSLTYTDEGIEVVEIVELTVSGNALTLTYEEEGETFGETYIKIE